MNSALRFSLSMAVGIAVAILIWDFLISLHPIFSQRALSGLIPSVLAGVIGGIVTSILAPSHKIKVALGCGSLIAIVLLLFMLKHGPKHFEQNPFLWYWPVYLPLCFSMGGGYLGRQCGIMRTALKANDQQ